MSQAPNKSRSPFDQSPFGLAPMEGVSDWSFRLWMAQAGAPHVMSTPFLRATDTFPKQLPNDFAPELTGLGANYALIPQVMASRPEDFVRSARYFLDAGADFVDLNCGCPSPNPVSGGAGSSLLKESEGFLRFLETIASALPAGAFSVKMRTGFHDPGQFFTMIDGLRDLPLRQLTIHGRTRSDRYDNESRWDLIEAAQSRLPYPVVASGDIVSHASWLKKKAAHPVIERVIIGRGALRNPWIFEELRQQKEVRISSRALVYALASFARLTELADENTEVLPSLIREGLWNNAAGSDEGRWRDLWSALRGDLSPEPLDAVCERFAFGRCKMIWNSLRSSLPELYFEPKLLRSKTLSDFLRGIAAIDDGEMTIRHQAAWDWLYTSSKKKPETADDQYPPALPVPGTGGAVT